LVPRGDWQLVAVLFIYCFEYGRLENNTAGSYNIGLGFKGGANIEAGVNNIDIGGASTTDESDTIRIGAQGTQTSTYIAGIFGRMVSSSGVPLLVDNAGKLGANDVLGAP
jgi:hypothetical protein